MGKVAKEKKHRGIHRDAGAFHPLEIEEAKLETVQDMNNKGTAVKSLVDKASSGLSRGQRKRKAKRVQKLRKGGEPVSGPTDNESDVCFLQVSWFQSRT
jgi:hypothetical protein